MTLTGTITVAVLVIAAALVLYLVAALVFPERF
ncbi:potassium-transporting ATPase subunit F [uncultured Williamsia sp.]|nr:potassium-transporting ATPase subunit F [uncultured Williamsia sp.]